MDPLLYFTELRKESVNLKERQQKSHELKHKNVKCGEKKRHSIQDLWNNIKWCNIRIIGMLEVQMKFLKK